MYNILDKLTEFETHIISQNLYLRLNEDFKKMIYTDPMAKYVFEIMLRGGDHFEIIADILKQNINLKNELSELKMNMYLNTPTNFLKNINHVK